MKRVALGAGILVALLAAAAMVGLPLYPSSWSSRRVGEFEVDSATDDGFGHRATTQTLYYGRGWGRTRVAKAARAFILVPNDPHRLIYDNCDKDVREAHNPPERSFDCVPTYFDGRTNHVIGDGLRVSLSQLDPINRTSDTPDRWSPNGRYVAIVDDYQFVIVDLTSGSATRFTEALDLSQPYYPERWHFRTLNFAGWSPSGTHAAVFVRSPRRPDPPVFEWHEQLYAIDAASGEITEVGTHDGVTGATGEAAMWRVSRLRWDGDDLLPPR